MITAVPPFFVKKSYNHGRRKENRAAYGGLAGDA